MLLKMLCCRNALLQQAAVRAPSAGLLATECCGIPAVCLCSLATLVYSNHEECALIGKPQQLRCRAAREQLASSQGVLESVQQANHTWAC